MSSSANIVTPEAVMSYVNIWKARAHPDSPNNLKYGVSLVIPKTADITELMAAYNGVLAADYPEGLPYGARAGGILDGAVRYPTDPYYADKWILAASQDEDRFDHKNVVGMNRQPIMDKSEIYSGAIGHGHISFYGYKGGSGGIGCSLHGLIKTRDGEHLGGSAPDSVDAFAAVGVGAAGVPGQPVPVAAVPGQPVVQTAPPPVPVAAPPVAAPVPVAAPAHVMTPAANGATYEQMIGAGWTDETLLANGMMVS